MANSRVCDIDAVAAGYKEGLSLRKLGALHGVSHEQIRKLLVLAGLDRLDGGGAIATLQNIRTRAGKAEKQQEMKELRSHKLWDMTCVDFDAHVAEFGNRNDPRSAVSAYMQHRQNANSRGIEWQFTFRTWWKVWADSGNWGNRGRHLGEYVMARYGDMSTPYSPDTVYICTTTENLKDGFISRPYNNRKRPEK